MRSTMSKKDLWNSRYYKKHSQPQLKSALTILDTITFNGNESVLDIGCGDGKITAEIARRVPEGVVIGIDASPDMIKQAQQDFSEIKNLSFICQNATEFVYQNQFDYITSFATIHWIENKDLLFKKIYQALKPKGKIFITAGTNSDSTLKKALITICFSPNWHEYFSKNEPSYKGLSIEAYEKSLINAGFTHCTVVEKFHSFLIPSQDFLVHHIMGWIPHATGLSGEAAEMFSREVAENMYKQKNTAFDLPIENESPFAYIEAQKLEL